MNLFDKCYSYTRAEEVKSAGIYPYFNPIGESEGPVVTMGGNKVIMAGSNNYLGLTQHPRVQEAAKAALKQYGTSCSGSRYLTGTIDLHISLEQKLADFMGEEACLLYSTGYQTGQGVISTLVGRNEALFSDKDNHASIVAGAMISGDRGGKVVRYKHNDMADLRRRLERTEVSGGKLIATDGVFSTFGNIVDLPELVKLAKEFDCRIMVDDAHAFGVIGEGGKGTASKFGLCDEVDMTVCTFSKTLASLGGFVVGKERVINYLKHHSNALIFSASPTPPSVAAAQAALEVLIDHPELVEKLNYNSNRIRTGLTEIGFEIMPGETAIVPVPIGDDQTAMQMWKMLFDAGVFVNVFIPPAVPTGKSMLRT
ncbi:pyridoxal phosphate-dependent aminotransferase family protein, partial [Chitinophagales bacterium]|nr:pyridoxal phosphate-dependent aminotransferase family protein [Chitinophagales bacterium]